MNDMTLPSGHRIRNSSSGGHSTTLVQGDFPHPQLIDIESEVQSWV